MRVKAREWKAMDTRTRIVFLTAVSKSQKVHQKGGRDK